MEPKFHDLARIWELLANLTVDVTIIRRGDSNGIVCSPVGLNEVLSGSIDTYFMVSFVALD